MTSDDKQSTYVQCLVHVLYKVYMYRYMYL